MRGVAAAETVVGQMSESRKEHFGDAMAAAAEGLGKRENVRAPWALLKPELSKDLTPGNRSPILRSAVKWAPGDEELLILKPLVERTVESDPDSAFERETEAIFLARSGRLDEASASYRQVLDAEPARVTALLGLAQLEAPAEPERAMELIDRALREQASSEQPFDPDFFLAAIRALGDSPGVEPLLDAALEIEPLNAGIAIRLGSLIEQREGADRRVLELARRGVRFQGGEEASEFLERVTERASNRTESNAVD
jgi:tetratricopeptide (TPR) repeat protein